MVRIGLTSPLRLTRELVGQLPGAPGRLMQLVQRPAAGLGESEDLGPQVGGAIGGQRQRHSTIGGRARRTHLAHPGELAQRFRDARAGGLDGDLDPALPLPGEPPAAAAPAARPRRPRASCPAAPAPPVPAASAAISPAPSACWMSRSTGPSATIF